MAKSPKPLVWAPFAAGGTLTAFLTPALILLTLVAALGYTPDILMYENLRAFTEHWSIKTALAGVLFLSLWSAAHRLRITIYDINIRADTTVAAVVYAVALAGTIVGAVYLVQI